MPKRKASLPEEALERANIETLERQEWKRPTTDGRQLRARKERDALLAQAVEKKGAGRIAVMLRHHDDAPISDPETWVRDAFDELLSFYGLVEIAIQAGYVSPYLPTDVADQARSVLGDPSVRAYYEDYYPLLLPQALRIRLEGRVKLGPESGDAARPLFTHFLMLNPLVHGDVDADTFLWLLDGGGYDDGGKWVDIDSVMRALDDPQRFLKRVLREPRGRRDQALHGLLKFIAFSVELDALLTDASELPLLQSSMWHYNAYWYRHLSAKIGGTLDEAMNKFTQWIPKPRGGAKKAKAAREVGQEIASAREAIHRLTSPLYRIELEHQLFS